MLASVPLAALHVDRAVSLRKSDCQATVRRYAKCLRDGECLPALDVCRDEHGEYWLADGFLRYDAHQLAGSEEVTVRVHSGGARGARLFACGVNDLHGRQRTVAEKRAAVARLLSDPEWQTWSDHLIAESCRVSHTFVAKMRTRLQTGENGENGERTGRDGRPVRRRAGRSLLPEGTWNGQSRPAGDGSGARVPGSRGQNGQSRPTGNEDGARVPLSQQSRPFRQKGPTTGPANWLRATPTGPGLCELPRLPVRHDLPPVPPAQAAPTADQLSRARDLMLAARGLAIEAQAVVPDPRCPGVVEGLDHALAHLLAWLERVDPHFEEEGRPPQLPQVQVAAANLHAERAELRRAVDANLAAAAAKPPVLKPQAAPSPQAAPEPAEKPAERSPPGESRLKSTLAGGTAAPPIPPMPAAVTPDEPPLTGQVPPWRMPAMQAMTDSCVQRLLSGPPSAESLATLPDLGWSATPTDAG